MIQKKGLQIRPYFINLHFPEHLLTLQSEKLLQLTEIKLSDRYSGKKSNIQSFLGVLIEFSRKIWIAVVVGGFD